MPNSDAIQSWNIDPVFMKFRREVTNITLVDHLRCWNIYQLAKSFTNTKGAFAEVGVYKGGTARILAHFGKPLHLFDTFTGMPALTTTVDIHQPGHFNDTSLKQVQAYLQEYSNIIYHKGIFPETTAELPKDIEFCFVHVDVDIYHSTKSACEYFYPRLINGGVILFDDYGFPSCPGNKLAVDEYFGDQVIYLPQGHCMVIKRS